MRSRHERSKLRTGMALAGAFAIGSAGAAVYWFAVLRASSPVLSPKERRLPLPRQGLILLSWIQVTQISRCSEMVNSSRSIKLPAACHFPSFGRMMRQPLMTRSLRFG